MCADASRVSRGCCVLCVVVGLFSWSCSGRGVQTVSKNTNPCRALYHAVPGARHSSTPPWIRRWSPRHRRPRPPSRPPSKGRKQNAQSMRDGIAGEAKSMMMMMARVVAAAIFIMAVDRSSMNECMGVVAACSGCVGGGGSGGLVRWHTRMMGVAWWHWRQVGRWMDGWMDARPPGGWRLRRRLAATGVKGCATVAAHTRCRTRQAGSLHLALAG